MFHLDVHRLLLMSKEKKELIPLKFLNRKPLVGKDKRMSHKCIMLEME